MNTSMSNAHMRAASNEDRTKLNNLERTLLFLPLAGGVVFGLLPFILGSALGKLGGFPGNDALIYRLAGAATFGYAVGLFLGIRQQEWAPMRSVVIAVLTFNLASIFAAVMAFMSGDTNAILYVILAASIAFVAISFWLLNRHADQQPARPDVSPWFIRFIILGTVLSSAFGILPLLIPVFGAKLFGFHGTDVYLIRLAGAASLGYGVTGVIGIRYGAWRERTLGMVMALIFNGFSFVACVVGLFSGEPILITLVIAVASLFVTIVGSIAYQRKGQL